MNVKTERTLPEGSFTFRGRSYYLSFLLTFLALLAMLAIFWAGWVAVHKPYSGLSWSFTTGFVSSVDPSGPAAGLFAIGDRLTAIDGIAVYEAREFPARLAGDQVTFTVNRGQDFFQVPLLLVRPPRLALTERLYPLAVAFFFLLAGALVLLFGRRDHLSILFFMLCAGISLVLSLGSISSYAPLWVGWAFSLLLWWIGPLALHTHALLAGFAARSRPLRAIKYVYSLVLLFNLLDLYRLQQNAPGPLLIIKYLWLGLSLLVAGWALYAASGRQAPADIRRRNRIAGLAALLAFAPFVLLSLFPDTLFGRFIVPYEISFLALPLLPLGYAYAIRRYQLIHLEPYLNRGAAYALAALLVAAIYGSLYLAAPGLLPGNQPAVSALGLAAMLVLVFTAYPLYNFLQRQVDKVFYGGWYDDRAAMQLVSRSLRQANGSIPGIAGSLCQALQKALQLEYVHLLLFNGELVSAHTRSPSSPGSPLELDPAAVEQWLSALHTKPGREIGPAAELAETMKFSGHEAQRILGRNPQFWLLLRGQTNHLGLLVVGPRRGGGILRGEHLEILEVVVGQAGAALENNLLLRDVRQHVAQVKELHRQVLAAREEERKWVARDLHDKTIQRLVGIRYHLANLRNRLDPGIELEIQALETELRSTLHDLRRICAGLRPPALEVLGLAFAIQTRLAEIQDQVPFSLHLDMDDLDGVAIPEQAAACLYRFINEGIVNAHRHADAGRVLVALKRTPSGRLDVAVEDDGRGFHPPAHLGLFTHERHFGLVGLREQLELVGGEMAIHSAPGQGCRITACIPVGNPDDSLPSASTGVTW